MKYFYTLFPDVITISLGILQVYMNNRVFGGMLLGAGFCRFFDHLFDVMYGS